MSPVLNLQWSSQPSGSHRPALTFRELADRYLESAHGDDTDEVERDLRNHILPRFGELRLDQVSKSEISSWLAATAEGGNQPPGTDRRLRSLLSQLWTLAVELKLPGAMQVPPSKSPGRPRMRFYGVQSASGKAPRYIVRP